MRRFVGMTLVALLALFVAFALVWRSWSEFRTSDAVTGFEAGVVSVEPGESARAAIARLQEAGAIRRSLWWRPWLHWSDAGRCLQAGTHEVPAAATPSELFDVLCQPTRRAQRRITVPEGTNIYELRDLLLAADVPGAGRVPELATSPAFLETLGFAGPSLEGHLFPDTYLFDADTLDAEGVLRRLLARFEEVWSEVAHDEAPAGSAAPSTWTIDGLDVTRWQLVTIASIVESEAVVAEERPRIAQVIYNRLRIGMPLQMDPTCVYGPEIYQERPSRARCRDPESRYSTYVIDGLPPTPIANPGRASLEAALAPSGERSLLYFVARQDGTGRHVFAETLREHNANVRTYLRGEGDAR